MTQMRRGPEKGRRVTADYGVRYWLTAKAYRALGETPPPLVLATDRDLGLEPADDE